MKNRIKLLSLVLALVMLIPVMGLADVPNVEELDLPEVAEEDLSGLVGQDPLELEGVDLPSEVVEDDAGARLELDLLPELTDPDRLDGGDYALEEGAQAANDTGSAWSDLQRQIREAEQGDIIKLDRDVNAADGDGYLVIPSYADVILDLHGWTLNRGLTSPVEGGVVLVVWGKLEVWDTWGGGKITGGYDSGNGGGIYVGKGGDLLLDRGTVCNNHAKNGGGVMVADGGKFTLGGGTIENNVADGAGGGVAVWGSADSPAFEYCDGKVQGNRAEAGGGVYLNHRNMTMKTGTIAQNEAKYGGGIFAGESTYCSIGTGDILDNTATETGGGIYINGYDGGATLECLSAMIIKGNRAKAGGGIMCNKSTVTLSSSFVDYNVSSDYGGGIYLYKGRLDTEYGGVRHNTAAGGGGGVYVGPESAFYGKKIDIKSNTADHGGGVGLNNGSLFEMQSGYIDQNTAVFGGGVTVGTDAQFRMIGGSIDENVAIAGDGGGIYTWKDAVVEMTGGSIVGNKVASGYVGGGGVFRGTLWVSGEVYVSGNYSGGMASNCYLGYQADGSHRITVTGPLYGDACIRVDYPWAGGTSAYPITKGLGAGGYLGAFRTSDYDYTVRWDYYGTEAEIVPRDAPSPQPSATPTPRPTATPTPKPTVRPTATPELKISLSQCSFSSIKNRTYTGKALKPAVTVKFNGNKLVKGTDYTVTYQKNKAVGVATVTVKGKGNFTGKKKLTFKILPRSSSISKLTAGKKGVAVAWNKRAEATGYQVQYALKSSFSGAKSVKVKGAGATSVTLKSLTAGKKYYIRVRVYTTAGKKTYYSAWSKAKSVKAK